MCCWLTTDGLQRGTSGNQTSDFDEDAIQITLKHEMHDPVILCKLPASLLGATKEVPRDSASLVVLHALPDDKVAEASTYRNGCQLTPLG